MPLHAVSSALLRSVSDGCLTDLAVGGNTINFSKHFAHVHAIEIDAQRASFLRHNVDLLCPTGKVSVHEADAIKEMQAIEQDIVFFDPPWGGVDYVNAHLPVDLSLSDQKIVDVCKALRGKTNHVVLKVVYFSACLCFSAWSLNPELGALQLRFQQLQKDCRRG